jgi:bacterioferritin
MSNQFDFKKVIAVLNKILETELAGVVRYTHYSLMIFGHNRIPIVSWLREQATESMAHAWEAGELITHFGEHPSLGIGHLLETHNHDISDILNESLSHENESLEHYKELHRLVKDKSIMLEEYASKMVHAEEMHIGEVNKMLRRPDDCHTATKKK